jgi:hypothetical protein
VNSNAAELAVAPDAAQQILAHHQVGLRRAGEPDRYVACEHSGSLSLYSKGGGYEVYSPVCITRTAAIDRR